MCSIYSRLWMRSSDGRKTSSQLLRLMIFATSCDRKVVKEFVASLRIATRTNVDIIPHFQARCRLKVSIKVVAFAGGEYVRGLMSIISTTGIIVWSLTAGPNYSSLGSTLFHKSFGRVTKHADYIIIWSPERCTLGGYWRMPGGL